MILRRRLMQNKKGMTKVIPFSAPLFVIKHYHETIGRVDVAQAAHKVDVILVTLCDVD